MNGSWRETQLQGLDGGHRQGAVRKGRLGSDFWCQFGGAQTRDLHTCWGGEQPTGWQRAHVAESMVNGN